MPGRVVLIGAAGGGIGRAVSRTFGAAGDHLVLADLDAVKLDALATELRASGTDVRTCTVDLSSDEGIARVFAVVDALGPVSVLVNTVGIARRTSVLDMTAAEFDRMLAVCVRSYVLCSFEAVRRMVATGTRGRILNISSIVADSVCRGLVHYATAKGAVDSFTRALAHEVAHHGITVNAIAPGSIRTDINAYLDQEPDLFAERLGGIPVGRFGVAEEIARAALWLAEPESSYITGVVLPVDGGASLPLPGDPILKPAIEPVVPSMAEPRRLW
jgi:NAD(P)-dependent dehydrogenase (short-subunit alcohol dehydrogenase family)